MKARLILDEDLRYVAFSEIYTRFTNPKTTRKAFLLIEGAVRCFDKKGFESASAGLIAKECGVTRPLLRHYFNDVEEIRAVTA